MPRRAPNFTIPFPLTIPRLGVPATPKRAPNHHPPPKLMTPLPINSTPRFVLEDKHHSKFGVSKPFLQPQFNLSSMASSSSVSVFNNYHFKTTFNEELYNTIVKNKKVITEVYFDLLDDEYPEIREQIALRGWRRLAAPKPEISIDLIHDFYANA
ncbi:hypothetical protein PIB30_061791 [Stylosanthes scabra]|uniref:Uncharacterized protein n=1 Tax=Stylosanthes scabra TaxID=79078 RepID=A0ABU6SM99_9FABA|nr:hypothetical protein [Stylosanthes scabra]